MDEDTYRNKLEQSVKDTGYIMLASGFVALSFDEVDGATLMVLFADSTSGFDPEAPVRDPVLN